jgi:hypothetical protein
MLQILINRIYVTGTIATSVTVLKIVKNFFLCNHKNIDKQKGDLLLKIMVYCFELRESGERPLQKTAAVTLPLFS